jgi:5-methyltetrahydropteroyltriglutamate--homocysteine methyltransferase
MHLCHAHFDHQHGSEGPYDVLMSGLDRLSVDTLSLELATPVSGGLDCLANFPEHMMLGLGCIDHCDRTIETEEVVAARVEQAMQYVGAERIVLHPDCGFSPSVQNPMDLDEAYAKLKAMCDTARLLRSRYT